MTELEQSPVFDSKPPSDEDDLATRIGHRLGRIVGVVFIILAFAALPAIFVLAGFALYDSLPSDEEVRPRGADPDFIDIIFAERWVVFATRTVLMVSAVVLLFVALLIVATVVVRISRRQWLRRVGWFEFDLKHAEAAVGEETDWLYESLGEALQRNEELERLVEERDAELREALDEMDKLVAVIQERADERDSS